MPVGTLAAMRRLFRLTAAIMALGAHSEAQVTVHVYNTAHIPSGNISGAEAQAGWIFEKAGIRIMWINCPAIERERGGDQICKQYADPGLLVMSILDEAPEAAIHDCTLGFALPFAGRGNHAAAMLPKVERVAHQNRVDLHIVLGHVMAHELAHLLFRSNAHGVGIMRSSWTEDDVMRMSQKRLRFTPDQTKGLRDGLAQRLSS